MTDVKAILAGIPLPMMVIDVGCRITMVNPAALELFGHDPGGMNAVTLLRQAAVLTAMDSALQHPP